MNTSQTLRTNIIKCLSDRKMSQIQLAVATQLHESVISRILAGKREINVYHLDKILMALQLDILPYFIIQRRSILRMPPTKKSPLH